MSSRGGTYIGREYFTTAFVVVVLEAGSFVMRYFFLLLSA